MVLKCTKLEEAGFKSAMIGLSLNKNQDPEHMPVVANKLAPLNRGHNKFMEHLQTWWLVTAPRYWWQDADTYRLSSKQSESTNHTVLKRYLTAEDFEDGDIDEEYLSELNDFVAVKDFYSLKKKLPEGFLQTREWLLSYKTIANIMDQRYYHKLPHWRLFCDFTYSQIDRPEFIHIPNTGVNNEKI